MQRRADGLDQLLGSGGLEKKPSGACLERTMNVLIGVEGGPGLGLDRTEGELLVIKTRTTNLHDARVDVKSVLSGLWVSMLFVFAYVDIFGFWRADVINGALEGKVPAGGSRSTRPS